MEQVFKYLPTVLFASYFGKTIYLGSPTGWDAAIILGTGAIAYALQLYSNDKKIKELEKQLYAEHARVNKKLDEHEQLIKDTNSGLASVKIGTGMRVRNPA